MKTKTDWGDVAIEYNKYIESDNNFHSDIIIPNLLRLIKGKNEWKNFDNKNVLDIACGQGVFAEAIKNENKNTNVFAFDAGADLIEIAKKRSEKSKNNINYFVLDAENFAKDLFSNIILNKNEEKKIEVNKNSKEENKSENICDIVVCVLAIQNIENVKAVLENIKKVTDKNSKIYFVINHPAFRIPKYTAWEYAQEGSGDNNKSIQYRRVDKYMSEDKIKMDMNPSEKREVNKNFTYSFHRPLQYYFKLFSNNNFAVTRLEEWVSNKNSVGKNSERENVARKEFPVFMCIEVVNS